MSDGGNNIYKYMTADRKLEGENSKSGTRDMITYFEKSTGVFNQDGIISDEELNAIRRRARAPKNLWHGFISFDEEHSKKIDNPEKCIRLVKDTFGEFFKDMGLSPDNVDLICSLHKDKPKHLHIHFWFSEKEPKCKYRKKETEYRHKGKIEQSVIDKMHERLTRYVEEEYKYSTTRLAIKGLKKISTPKELVTKEAIQKELIALAKIIPKNATLSYSHEDMEPYRKKIDKVVTDIIAYDKNARKSGLKFYAETGRLRDKAYGTKIDILEILMNLSKFPLKEDPAYPNALKKVEETERDYTKEQGDIILRAVKEIKSVLYEPRGKHKVNDKRLKRAIAISDRKVGKAIEDFLSSFANDCENLECGFKNRLQQIEAEMEEKNKKEEQENLTDKKPEYDWGK